MFAAFENCREGSEGGGGRRAVAVGGAIRILRGTVEDDKPSLSLLQLLLLLSSSTVEVGEAVLPAPVSAELLPDRIIGVSLLLLMLWLIMTLLLLVPLIGEDENDEAGDK